MIYENSGKFTVNPPLGGADHDFDQLIPISHPYNYMNATKYAFMIRNCTVANTFNWLA